MSMPTWLVPGDRAPRLRYIVWAELARFALWWASFAYIRERRGVDLVDLEEKRRLGPLVRVEPRAMGMVDVPAVDVQRHRYAIRVIDDAVD